MGLYEEFKTVLDTAKNEHDVDVYLKSHKDLMRWIDGLYWNCMVIQPEFQIGTEYRADFVVLCACSGCWKCVLIELQSPTDPIFNKNRQFSRGMNEAYNQLSDWKSYIEMNETSFRYQLAKLVKGKPAYCSNAAVHTRASEEIRDPMTVIQYEYRVMLGRREMLDAENNRKRQFCQYEIMTYDRILRQAKNYDDACDAVKKALIAAEEKHHG